MRKYLLRQDGSPAVSTVIRDPHFWPRASAQGPKVLYVVPIVVAVPPLYS